MKKLLLILFLSLALPFSVCGAMLNGMVYIAKLCLAAWSNLGDVFGIPLNRIRSMAIGQSSPVSNIPWRMIVQSSSSVAVLLMDVLIAKTSYIWRGNYYTTCYVEVWDDL